MCCASPLPDHHSPEPADPQISVVVPCHGVPSADLYRAAHGFEGWEEIKGDTQFLAEFLWVLAHVATRHDLKSCPQGWEQVE